MEEVIQKLVDTFKELRAVTGMSAYKGVLYPPANEGSIDAFESSARQKFPPSYRTFLGLHNGWEAYENIYTLIGVTGEHTTKAMESINRTISIYTSSWIQRHGEPTEEAIRRFEAGGRPDGKTEDECGIYLPKQFAYATDFAGGLYCFRIDKISADGEMEVIERTQIGEIVRRHRNFLEMLKLHLAVYQATLEKRKARKKR